jgi:zinc protease
MKRSTYILSSLVALGLASACAPTTPQFSVHQPVLKAKLNNGIRVVVVPDVSTPLVQVDVRYEVGANEDPVGKAGLAHLVEHMMFQHRFGPDSVPIENRAPTFQHLPQLATFFNAYTTWDKTHYFLQAPKEDLENLIKLEAARLNAGCTLIPEEQFQREREVVRAEIRGSLENAEGLMIYEALRLAYPEKHPYHEMVGGNDEQLSNITMADVCKFMKDFYVPSRTIVVVTGNADSEAAGKMVNKYFSGIAPGTPAPRFPVTPVKLKKQKVSMDFDMERTVVNVLWALPPHYTAEHDNAWFMQYAFASTAGSLADEYDVCKSTGAFELGGSLAPVMWAGFEVHKGKSASECLDFIWMAARQTHRFFETGTNAQERGNRARAKQSFVEQMEAISSRAGFVADGVQFDKRVKFTGEDNYFYKHLDGIDNLDSGKFKSFVKKTMNKDKAIVFIAKASTTGAKRDRRSNLKFSKEVKTHEQKADPLIDPSTANQPLPAPTKNSILAGAERYTLKNGMKVVLLPYKGMPIVQANLLFKTGAIHEPEAKAGLAGMAASINLPFDSVAMAAAGVSVGGRGGMDNTTFSSSGINIYLPEIINGLERVIKVGQVSQRSIERYRRSFKDQFDRDSYQRGYIFGLTREAAIYGEKHPYVTKGDPTPKTLSRFGMDDSHSFGRKHYSAKNATLIVAGSFDAERAKGIISDSFGDWGGGHKDKPVALDSKPAGSQYIGVIGKKGMSQMQISISYPTPAGRSDHYAERVLLGEMMNLQMSRVRSELGSTYGVRAGLVTRVGPGYFSAGGSVDATRAGESLKFMRTKLQELRDGADFDQYFVTARQKILKQLLAESTESYSLAGRLTQIESYDLPADYIDRLAREVASMTPAKVKAILTKDLDPKNEIIVNMADRETLTKSFEEAGLEGFRIIDPLIK